MWPNWKRKNKVENTIFLSKQKATWKRKKVGLSGLTNKMNACIERLCVFEIETYWEHGVRLDDSFLSL